MTSNLVIHRQITLIPSEADKHARYRLGKFEHYQADLLRPDLAAYRDYLIAGKYKPATISAHLSTVRAAYSKLIRDRDLFYSQLPSGLSPSDGKSLVDEIIERLKNATDPKAAPVETITKQDILDSEHLRLTTAQADSLMARPGLGTIKGKRDTALISLMLCTGLRESELSSLDIDDLRQDVGGELVLYVREGKGKKSRAIPYGDLSGVLVLVDDWLKSVGVTEGSVFRGLYKGGETLRPDRIKGRAIQYILSSYPIAIDGKLRHVKPHDLRRTYARRLYEAGMDLLSIQQNLGHASQQTTLGYIGQMNIDSRRPPKIYSFIG